MASKVYSNYTESGSPWLGQIPGHWSVKKLKFLAVVQPSNVDKKTIDGEEPVLLCNYTDVYKNEYIDSRLEFMSATATSTEIEKFSTDIGDVIVTKDSEDPSDIAIPACISEKIDGLLCGYHLTQIKPIDLDGRYLLRLFQSKGFNAQFIILANGVTRFGLPQYAISNAYSCTPPMPEQKGIARFLDFKTAQIDALIGKQKTLLDKLAEKRTALISHAVTKGLDPSVSMKDSGVEWLGSVPSHWKRGVKLNYLAAQKRNSFVNGPFGSDLLSSELTDDGIPVIYSGDVKPNRFYRKSSSYVTTEKAEQLNFCRVDPGDLLLAKVGDPPGDAAIYPSDAPSGIVTQDVVRIKLNNEIVDTQYLTFLLNSTYGRFVVRTVSVEATRGRFSLGDFKSLRLVMPPLHEQREIVKIVVSHISPILNLEDKVIESIKKLQEYRSTLITNAVTGKIDVRDFSIPENCESQQTECA